MTNELLVDAIGAKAKTHKELSKLIKSLGIQNYEFNGKVITLELPVKGFTSKHTKLADAVCSDWVINVSNKKLVIYLRNYKRKKEL